GSPCHCEEPLSPAVSAESSVQQREDDVDLITAQHTRCSVRRVNRNEGLGRLPQSDGQGSTVTGHYLGYIRAFEAQPVGIVGGKDPLARASDSDRDDVKPVPVDRR